MKKIILLFNLLLVASLVFAQKEAQQQNSTAEKTAFQTGSPWIPEIDVRSDAAIVYGAGDRNGLSFEDRVKSWKNKGYTTQFMTGIAWGQYSDYFLGNPVLIF
jgi:hypothetical protein